MNDSSRPGSGDRRHAFARVMRPLVPGLYRTARRLTQRPAEATEVTRDAALRAWLAFDDQHPRPDVRGWMFGELRAALAELWRREEWSDPPATGAEEASLFALGSSDPGVDVTLLSRLDGSPDVDVALRALAKADRLVVLLMDVEGLGPGEAAQVLACDVETVRRRLLGLRARLFVFLSDYARPDVENDAGMATPSAGCSPERLQEAFDGELAPAERQTFDGHLRSCDWCPRALYALRWTTLRLAGAAASLHVPPGLAEDLERAVEQTERPPAS